MKVKTVFKYVDLLSWGIKYEFQGPSLHRVAEIKIPNWLTFGVLLFLADSSAGLTGFAAAIRGEEKWGSCET